MPVPIAGACVEPLKSLPTEAMLSDRIDVARATAMPASELMATARATALAASAAATNALASASTQPCPFFGEKDSPTKEQLVTMQLVDGASCLGASCLGVGLVGRYGACLHHFLLPLGTGRTMVQQRD